MNIVINRMKELESEVAHLKKENEALSRNYKTLETEKSRENEALKATIKRLEYSSETAHRMLGEAFDDYRDLKEQLKRSDELVQFYIKKATQAEEKLSELNKLHEQQHASAFDYSYEIEKLKKEITELKKEKNKKDSELKGAKTVIERYKAYYQTQAEARISNALSKSYFINIPINKQPQVPIGIDPLLVTIHVDKTI